MKCEHGVDHPPRDHDCDRKAHVYCPAYPPHPPLVFKITMSSWYKCTVCGMKLFYFHEKEEAQKAHDRVLSEFMVGGAVFNHPSGLKVKSTRRSL